ncbi:YbaB/EbfC family nucleoid-associated protein [Nocardia sp. NPDC004604]|uniref:YbaB/EbfC family nucleoid-associated protein n=1 Tax=Nocardia sp. NPDC004604 TaxID=3157013 RepID=UPI00339F860E
MGLEGRHGTSTVSASAADGRVVVEVDCNGKILSTWFAPEARELSPAALGDAVTCAARAAASRAAHASGVAMLTLTQLTVRDRTAITEYTYEMSKLVEEYGGEILAVSNGNGECVEGAWRTSTLANPDTVILLRWPHSAAFHEFYQSTSYAPLAVRRRRAADSHILLFDDI